MRIRRASPGDFRRLAELHVLARYDMAYLPHVHSFVSVEKWMRETIIPRQHVWVAEIDDAVVGYASLYEGFLTKLYVHPSHQRRGIGGALLAEVKKSAPDGFRFWLSGQSRCDTLLRVARSAYCPDDRWFSEPGEAAGSPDEPGYARISHSDISRRLPPDRDFRVPS
jgi:GNAT superfamily N-acetyltransferase